MGMNRHEEMVIHKSENHVAEALMKIFDTRLQGLQHANNVSFMMRLCHFLSQKKSPAGRRLSISPDLKVLPGKNDD